MSTIINCFEHESGHANSWDSDNEMTAFERADLILKVYKRVTAANRFLSSYVESINEKSHAEAMHTRTVEYWAEICGQYFADFTKLNIEDYLLVDQQVRKTDKKFDIAKARSTRKQIIDAVVKQYSVQRYATQNNPK